MEMLVNIPDMITDVKTVSQTDIALALVIQLYVDEEGSLAKAAEMTGMNRFEFQKLLADKNIPLRCNSLDLSKEMQTVQEFLITDHQQTF